VLIRAARYLKVAPWELAKQPSCWLQWAIAAEAADTGGDVMRRQLQKQKDELGDDG